MNYLITGLFIILIGCAHHKNLQQTVEFPYAEELLKKIQFRDFGENLLSNQKHFPAKTPSKSPRRVYFRTLYGQYQILSQILYKKNEISFCPQYHHDKIETNLKSFFKVDLFKNSSSQNEVRNYFPESAFVTKSSLVNYLQSIRQELETLCEEGVTDNFFKFDNLITHYSHKPSFHQNSSAMSSVLKIPVFANFYLIKMIYPSRILITSFEELDFIRLTKTFWFETYVTEASRVRNSFIRNRMVRGTADSHLQ